jgi:hypothetical protein
MLHKIITVFACVSFFDLSFADKTVFNLVVKGQCGRDIKVTPAQSLDLKLEGEPVVVPQNESEKKVPSMRLETSDGDMSVKNGEAKKIIVYLGERDFSSIGLAKGDSIVQQLRITPVDDEHTTIGFVSFRCSVFNINPIITLEPLAGYKISEESMSIGGGSNIFISVSKAP